QEESHHRGHEIGVRDFPRAAMVLVCALPLLFDDDDRALIVLSAGGHVRSSSADQAAALALPFSSASRSPKVGRMSLQRSLRANSIATPGTYPRTVATSAIFTTSNALVSSLA